MHLNDIAEDVYKINESNGWHEDFNPVEKCMMVVTEVAEAVDELRTKAPEEHYYTFYEASHAKKPEGFGTELADVIIRTLDIMRHYGFDIETLVTEKLECNKTRGYKHGGKNY